MRWSVLTIVVFSLLSLSGTLPVKSKQAVISGPIDKELFGINLQSYFENKKNISTSGASQFFEDLKPSNVRFPGGGVSNFYRYDRNRKMLVHPSKPWKISLDTVAQFCRDHNVAMSLVLNLYSGDLEENLDLVEYFLEQKVKVVGVELSNELYFKNWKVSPEEYIENCEAYSKIHRQRFPDIKIVALAAQIGNSKSGTEAELSPFSDYMRWNRLLSQADFYDAISFHWYIGQKHCIDKFGGNETGFFRCNLSDIKGYYEQVFPKVLTYFQETFPGKEIWVTEWNLYEPNKSGNTFFHALYIQEFLLQMALVENNGARIGILNYLNFTTHNENRTGYNILSVQNRKTPDKKYIPHAGYFAMLMIRDVFVNNSYFVPVNLKLKQEALPFYTYAFRSQESYSVLFANTDFPIDKISSLEIDGHNIALDKKARVCQLRFSDTFAKADSIAETQVRWHDFDDEIQHISINPLSITKIDISL